jgi:hypothetical protein
VSISAQSLPDGLCQALRLNAAVVSAFGDTYNSSLTIAQNSAAGNVSKFWSDYADQISQPYLVFEEVGETYDFMSRAALATVNFTCTGTTVCRIVHYSRATARSLGILVCNALNDCESLGITWPGFHSPAATCTLDSIRMTQAAFVPDPNIGPGVPTTFNRVIPFSYFYQGQL